MAERYLSQAWLVVTLALVFGATLAGVQLMLADRIAANKLQETLGRIPDLVPGSTEGVADQVSGRTVYRAMSGEVQVGWVVPATGQGFAGPIEILIGLSEDIEKLTGIYVLDQRETPGLGNKITEEEWLAQFEDKNTASPVRVRAGQTQGQEIIAVTGATISSETVCAIVNQTISGMKSELANTAGGGSHAR